jgi:serine/threonine protein kinase/predicted DsbA family dithiol-disulfide isomerase
MTRKHPAANQNQYPVVLICARCGENTYDDPCAHCGESPFLEARYELREVLGAGAEGTTYRARLVEGGAIVAVKEMPLRRAKDDKARELLSREAGILRQLHHEAIPRYLDDFTSGVGKTRAFYLVQEYIDGRTLAEEEQDRRYDLSEILALLEELLDVLVYLHGLNPPVIHRDVKPSNVMRRQDGGLVLIDFGSVRDVLADMDLGGETVTGTFGYMAPEQMMGDASEASDLYGLGALVLKLLSRREPHTLLRHDRTLDWEPFVQAPRPVRSLLDSLLQPDPEERARDARTVRDTVRGLRRMSESELNAPTQGTSSPMTDLMALIKRRGRGGAEENRAGGESDDTVRSFTPAGIALIVVLSTVLVAAIVYPRLAKRDSRGSAQSSYHVSGPQTPSATPVETSGSVDGLPVDTRVEVGPGTYPPRSGETDASIVIVVFTSFACDQCGRFSATLARVDHEYGDQVAVYVRDYPVDFHGDGYVSHEGARCAHAQGGFWPMHDRMFATTYIFDRDLLTSFAEEVGLDRQAFASCLRSGVNRLDIEIDRKAGRDAGVHEIPTFVINGVRHDGAVNYSQLKALVELALVEPPP